MLRQVWNFILATFGLYTDPSDHALCSRYADPAPAADVLPEYVIVPHSVPCFHFDCFDTFEVMNTLSNPSPETQQFYVGYDPYV